MRGRATGSRGNSPSSGLRPPSPPRGEGGFASASTIRATGLFGSTAAVRDAGAGSIKRPIRGPRTGGLSGAGSGAGTGAGAAGGFVVFLAAAGFGLSQVGRGLAAGRGVGVGVGVGFGEIQARGAAP